MSATEELQPSPLGPVPSDWRVVRVDEAGQVLGGRQRSPSAVGEATKYLRVANVFDGYIDTSDVLEMPFTAAERDRFALRYGDILLNEGQSLELVGRSAIFRGEVPGCAYQNTLIRFRVNKGVVPEFVQAIFHRYVQSGVFAGIALQTTSIAHLGVSRLASLALPLPEEKEQRSIAEALTDIDVQLETLNQLIAKKRDLKQAAMQQLLTGRVRLAEFREPWRESSFGELFEFLRNASNSRAELSASGDVGYVHYGDIHLHRSPIFDAGRDLSTFIDAVKVKSMPPLRDGDLLMADASEDTDAIGKAVEITGLRGLRAVGGLHTLVLRPRPGRLARGFAGHVQFMPAVRAALVRAATGVSVYGVSKSSVRAIVTPLPGVAEQSAIAQVLSDMGEEITALAARRDKTRQLKQGMMQALLTGRIRLT